ncbi:putative murein hydrolase (TIGR00659 family) [Bacillus fengqiuensis]|nr:putative murein hydrolase (TIGR00659 family) [Bacillus fengqiuensis]
MVWIAITIILYLLAVKVYSRFPFPFTLPVLTVTAGMICVLVMFGMSHDDYVNNGGKWISELLGPAIVALAVPLFKQRHILMKNFASIVMGAAAGIIILMIVNISIGKMLGMDQELIFTSIPQLTTMPIAVSLADQIGGIPSLTAVFVMIAGILGGALGPVMLKLFRITSTVGKGVGLGCASHIIGVTQMMKESEEGTTIASVTMIVTGLLASILVPYILFLFF